MRPRPGQRKRAVIRAQVFIRDGGCCVPCGIPLDSESWECHHRRYRSRGGSDDLFNLIACCQPCHADRIHGSPELALQRGWAVSQFGPGPELIPVRYADGREVLLSNDAEVAA